MPIFRRATGRSRWPTPQPGLCYLRDDNWDDYGFKTVFGLRVVTPDGTAHDIGLVKIAHRGLETGRITIPDDFDSLDESFCSLGQDQNYYEQLAALPNGLGFAILHSLRDCVADPTIWEGFKEERVVQISLLRSVGSSFVEKTFREILRGQAPSTPYEFVFKVAATSDAQHPIDLDVKVLPNSTPPTNVHVLIGRNGVGKSRILAGISTALTASKSSPFGMEGAVKFQGEMAESDAFANLVTVAFSAFDRFTPLHATSIKGNIRYAYVGLKQEPDASSNSTFKTLEELAREFSDALEACLEGPRRSRWQRTMEILGTDPGFAELELGGDSPSSSFDTEVFQRLSSGHKLVLLTAARLVELVDERTLVLLDEPESHLHPPLLSSFIRALSDLLVLRNGVAIIATHSPVVLQEVPRSCVWVLRRSGDLLSAYRPTTETFGENVGTLTHEIFQLEVTDSGFHKMLADAAETMTYDQVLEKFGHQIGAEGRAIARVLTATTRR